MLEAIFAPFLNGDLANWRGLPEFLSLPEFQTEFGPGEATGEEDLGYYPATTYRFVLDAPSGGLRIFVRNGKLVLIEGLRPPAWTVVEGLTTLCGTLPPEILASGGAAPEYIYCSQGLALTLLQPFGAPKPVEVLRARGFRPIAAIAEFGPEFYKDFRDKNLW